MSHSDRGRTRWRGASRDGEGKAADGKRTLSVTCGDSSPNRGAFGKKILFFVDCQGLSYKERWHPEGMTERLNKDVVLQVDLFLIFLYDKSIQEGVT